jgi:lipocalin
LQRSSEGKRGIRVVTQGTTDHRDQYETIHGTAQQQKPQSRAAAVCARFRRY